MTCCMQWKIAVDDKTYDDWKNVRFQGEALDSYVTDSDNGRIIRLDGEKKCPFLNGTGLCNLVINHGDGILSHTCDVFPRQIHDFGNRKEYSLVSCCPEVIDIFNREKCIEFIHNTEIESEDELFLVRSLLTGIISNRSYPVQIALLMAFYILLDIYGKNKISGKELSEYQEEKTLNELYAGIMEIDSAWEDTFDEDNELWLDMVENYRKEGLYSEYIEEISGLAEQFTVSYDRKAMKKQLKQFDMLFKDYENLFRNYLVSELFTNMLIPESDLEGMVIMMQWTAMEYVLIRHGLFLKWLQKDNVLDDVLSYENVRDYIVVISRMTGYDEADIYEYMENSFQSIVWEWGYMALIVGGIFNGL